MTNVINILVVEDDDDQWQTYQDSATEHSNETREINLIRHATAIDARNALLSNDIDGAIIDLNLESGNPNEASGNEVLLEITGSHRFPVVVVSGNLGHLDRSVRRSGFLKTFDRDTTNKEIFGYLLKVYDTGITRILGGRGQIEKLLGEIFWSHLACSIDSWNAGDHDSERMLLRYTVAHLAEYLDTPDGENRFYHDAECYIMPPIREHIATGDIVDLDGVRYIVLSPACDVAVRSIDTNGKPLINADKVVLAPLIEVARAPFIDKNIIREDDNAKRLGTVLETIAKGQREKYVFLPKYDKLYPAVIDLQTLHTVPFEEYLNASRLATISSAFLKDIQSRFSAYYGRQGQPDLDKDKLVRENKAHLLPAT